MKSILTFILLVSVLAVPFTCAAVEGVIAVINDAVIRPPEITPYDNTPESREVYLRAYRRGYAQAMKGSDQDPKAPADITSREATLVGFRAGQEAAAASGHKSAAKLKVIKPDSEKK